MDSRIPVGLLGAAGTVGSRIVDLLRSHPWFRLAEVYGSPRTAGRRLGDAHAAGPLGPLPRELAELEIRTLADAFATPLLLSALPAAVARTAEPAAAAGGRLVVSNASAFRTDPAVPLVIPEVNPDHLELLAGQRDRWPGGIVTNPNCVVSGVAMALAPLHRAFGIERVVVSTYQAISGAGRPGPGALDLVDNLLPFIPGEEEKIAAEPLRILGAPDRPATFRVDATAVRVPVLHGHLASVSVGLGRAVGTEEAAAALRDFRPPSAVRGLPTVPERPLELLEEGDRPQPRLDRDRGGGMTVTVGRLREGRATDLSFVVLVHNLVRGAAAGAVANAELCVAAGALDGRAAA